MRRLAGPAALFAVALAVRLRGLSFGLPLLSNYYIRPDESLVVVPAVELVARLGDPGHVNYPAAMMAVLSVAAHAWHAVMAAAGLAEPTLLEDFGRDPSRYFLAGRALSAVCGAALTVVVYRMATRLTAPLPATVAALWYALSPLAVREAHFAVTDTMMALLTVLAVLASLRVVEAPADRRRRLLAVCGVLAGAAVATKYPAAVIVPALALVLAFPGERSGSPVPPAMLARWWALPSALTFAALNPWLVTHPAPLLAWLRRIAAAIYAHRDDMAAAAAVTPDWPAPGDYLWLMPGGWVGATLAMAGMGLAARAAIHGDRRMAVVLAPALAFVLLLAPARTLPFRYLAPLLPLAAVLAALALDQLRRRLPRPAAAAVVVAACGAGLATTVPATWHLVNSLALEDTRSDAGRWIRAHVPPSVPIVWLGMPESEPQLIETPASIRRRIAWVERTYGAVAARDIERPYLRALEAAPRPDGHEVYRNPLPEDVTAPVVCVVQAMYPSPTVITDAAAHAAWTTGSAVAGTTIGVPLPSGRHLLEPWDAFFLPLNLAGAMRPGPRFVITIVSREKDVAPR